MVYQSLSDREKNIVLESEKKVEQEWRLDGMDMVVIVGNLLDNAIENCPEEKKQPKIQLKIIQKMSQVQIEVSNTKEGKSRNGDISQYSTTKQNRILHGYGLENVNEIVKKHHGKLQITDKEQWFTVKIIMECGDSI